MYLVIYFEDLREGEIGSVVGHITKVYAHSHDIYCDADTLKSCNHLEIQRKAPSAKEVTIARLENYSKTLKF